MNSLARIALVLACFNVLPTFAQDFNLGFEQLPQADGSNTTVFFPTTDAEASAKVGPFTFSWAKDAIPVKGNGHLVVISHGSGGSPWVHSDLARTLVQRGFTVAIPLHQGDNYLDHSDPGPASWVKRPVEVSRAIDALAANPKFGSMLSFDSVGLFGGSSGGHTALTLAGGQSSASRFRDYCLQNIAQDFSSCVGFLMLLHGDWLDGPKMWVAKQVIAWRFSDETVVQHSDSRIKGIIAMVPFAADFDPASLAEPRTALGLVIAEKDINQIPKYHVNAVRKACEPRCEVVMTLTEGSHGSMLSPMPPLAAGSINNYLLGDPPTFNRSAEIPVLNARVADFFVKTLLPVL